MKVTVLVMLAVALPVFAAVEDDGVINYREYSPTFASAGQPTAKQFEELRQAGFERVVYIAWSDHEKSLANEDRDGVPAADAKADLDSVWRPDENWRDLIFAVLEDNDVSPHCDGCDWTIQEH